MLPSLATDRRQSRSVTAILVLGVLLVAAVAWSMPRVRRGEPGLTPDQVALQRETARADDLARQVEELSKQLAQPQPPPQDTTQQARADDLARQLEDAEARLQAPRAPFVDPTERARADDLSRRVADLNAQLTRPRPTIDPLASVTASLTKAQILAGRNLMGLYTQQAPFNYAEVDLVQSQVERKANIIGYFQSWRDPFNERPIRTAWQRGQIPLLTWESLDQIGTIKADEPDFNLARIYGGAHDDYIRSYARGLAALKMPIILRLNHEMNAQWYPWSEIEIYSGRSVNGNQRGDYVKMWRHVHEIFAAEGANDYVIWLWSPNRINQILRQPDPVEFYPGDTFVDWIGMSGYYRFYDEAATFAETFGLTLPKLRETSTAKPLFLSEIGATELENHKVAWIKDLFRGLAANEDIIGFAWFSHTVTAPYRGEMITNDWRINSSFTATNAVRDELARTGYGVPL